MTTGYQFGLDSPPWHECGKLSIPIRLAERPGDDARYGQLAIGMVPIQLDVRRVITTDYHPPGRSLSLQDSQATRDVQQNEQASLAARQNHIA